MGTAGLGPGGRRGQGAEPARGVRAGERLPGMLSCARARAWRLPYGGLELSKVCFSSSSGRSGAEPRSVKGTRWEAVH